MTNGPLLTAETRHRILELAGQGEPDEARGCLEGALARYVETGQQPGARREPSHEGRCPPSIGSDGPSHSRNDAIQAIALVLFIVTVRMSGSVGIREAVAPLLSGQHSLTFWLGAVLVGLVVPLALQFAGGGLRRASAGVTALVAILVLVGGFVIKYVLVAAGQVT